MKRKAMARFKTVPWLLFLNILLIVHYTNAEGSGLSAVIETDQDIPDYYYYYSSHGITDWVATGRPGLFITDDFKMDNSTFQVMEGGVYYVSANLIIMAKRKSYYRYDSTVTWQGRISLDSDEVYISYRRYISTYVTMEDDEQKNLRVSGYLQLEPGWKVSIKVPHRYRWSGTIKAGSTLSMMYVSKPSLFPGVLLRSYSYGSLYLNPPSYSASVVDWDEMDEGSSFPTSEGSFQVPHNGLYHVLVNLNIRVYDDIMLKFSIVINNQTEAIHKTTNVESSNTNTVTIEGILDLVENQTISVAISSPNHTKTDLSIYYGSTFFIFSKGILNSHSVRAVSTSYQGTSTGMPPNRFSTLNKWDTSSKHSFTHYSNIRLQQGEFVAPKSGIYQINFALYLSSCTTAKARILWKNSTQTYLAIGPDVSFTQESIGCVLQNSLLLKLQESDRLRLQVQSDMKYKVLSQTLYQVVFQASYTLWPAAIFILPKPFQFKTNSAAVKVHDWLHHTEDNWNDLFFDVNKHTIQIQVPGLYLISYNLVVKTTLIIPFYSQIIVNNAQVADSGSCQRGSASEIFTCTASTLLNLVENDNLAVQVWMSDGSKSKQSVQIQNSSRLTVTLLGDIRSNPTFKLSAQPPKQPYTTKPKQTDIKSLSDFTFPNASFFQSSALYSKSTKTFNSAKGKGYVLLNTVQFNQQNNGYLASALGSGVSNMMVYSRDHKTSKFSLSVSDLALGSQFYFNVSGEASKSDLKWQPEAGTVVSGVYVGDKETMTALQARLKPNQNLVCATEWTLTRHADWDSPILLNDLGKITIQGVQIVKSGFYLTSLNLAVTANISNTVIDVGIFLDQDLELSATETSPTDGKFSIFLQSVLQVTQGQDIDIKVKCSKPTTLTYADGGGIFSLKVDQTHTRPGMRKRMSLDHISDNETGTLSPWNSYGSSDEGYEEFVQNIRIHEWKIKVKQSGLYFISMVGYTANPHNNFELAFSSPADNTDDASCPINSSPLYFKTTSNHLYSSVALTGFVLLDKDNISGFLGQYEYWGSYNSRFYMSLQFVGDLDTSSGFTATLQKDISLQRGNNKVLNDKSWISSNTCAKFTTKDAPSQFGKYKVLYAGYYLISMNLVLDHKDGSDVEFCFTVNGKKLTDVGSVKGLNVGCFLQHLAVENGTRMSTVSGAELFYLEADNELSVQISTSFGLTISKKSSFSAFYLGTPGSILGFSSVIDDKSKLRELPSYEGYFWDRYDDDDEDYAQYVVEGWQTNFPQAKMFFENGVEIDKNDMFISPQNGVYLVMVKMRINATNQANDTCKVKLELAVDGEVLDFAFIRDFVNSVDTLSFTTTLRLEKWQGVTVRLSKKRLCASMKVENGSSLAILYLDGGKTAFTLWPNIGPHIVEFPAEHYVYVREDKTKTPQVKCLAVGKYNITYEWKTYYDTVLNKSSSLDPRLLNDSTSVRCVATMKGLVAESNFVSVKIIDPTVIFGSDYENRTYYLPEKNDTTKNRYEDVLTISVKEKKVGGYYYWFWERHIDCDISKGNVNSTFDITTVYSYYDYYSDYQRFKLRAWLPKLDRETISEYNIEITCKNLEYSDARKAVTTIRIDILDSNDNLPVFEKEIYFAKVPKNVQSGEDIIQVHATDDDANENGKITYSLVLSGDSYIFNIDKTLGVISLRDKEKLMKPNYRLSAVATDQGHPPRSGYVTVVLEVQDFPTTANQSKNPIFPQRFYTAYLIWGTPKGTRVITVHAHDPVTFDHQNIWYYIFSGDRSVFEVNAKTGEITTKGSVTKAEYYLEIAAEYKNKAGQAHGEFYNTTMVVVYVRKFNTNMPHFIKTHYKKSLSENSKINTQVLTVGVEYKKSFEYYLPNTNESVFKVDKKSGVISLAGKLDYEIQRSYTFVVSARDSNDHTKSSCVDVTVYVLDCNDNAPVITYYPQMIRVDADKLKGSKKIGHVNATDKDTGTNGEIRYYLVDDYRGSFTIVDDTGELYVKGPLSCCDVKFLLKVVAKDQGRPPLESAEVEIQIIPFTDNPHTDNPHTDNPHTDNPHTEDPSDKKKYIIAGVVGGVAVIIILVGAIYMWTRRQRNNASVPMNYLTLPSDEDDPLLDDGSDHEDDTEGNRRLSLISAASDDNLLRNEAPC